MKNTATANWIKMRAVALGFTDCRIAAAVPLDNEARRLESWLNKGFAGTMHYIEKHFDLRIDPTKLVPGAKSVITLVFNYFPEAEQAAGVPKIARYAFGHDYHDVLRAKLNELLQDLRAQVGHVEGRGFVDSAPVLERAWAVRSGLGWVGKNGNLIRPKNGSYFFIATLITDLDLPADSPFQTDHCGSCTRCLDACPTGAIVAPTVVDATRCISYLTIELKEALMPAGLEKRSDNWIFGCDICQEVCPWNRFSKPQEEPLFQPLPHILNISAGEWEEMSEDAFRAYFKGSPVKRAKWAGLQRNLKAIV